VRFRRTHLCEEYQHPMKHLKCSSLVLYQLSSHLADNISEALLDSQRNKSVIKLVVLVPELYVPMGTIAKRFIF
jgi:hypothetical protein